MASIFSLSSIGSLSEKSNSFESLPLRISDPKLCKTSSCYQFKNRYTNILAPDATRVSIGNGVLPYINANFVALGGGKKAIATQGPTRKTTFDFWKMVYYLDVKAIFMLTPILENGKYVCSEYWPNSPGGYSFVGTGYYSMDIEVMSRGSPFPEPSGRRVPEGNSEYKEFDNITITRLVLHGSDGPKEVLHFYYSGWADTGISRDGDSLETIRGLISKATEFIEKDELVVVHCSGGVNRTGAVMTCLRSIFSKESPVDALVHIRQDRHGFVKTEEMFKFAHQILGVDWVTEPSSRGQKAEPLGRGIYNPEPFGIGGPGYIYTSFIEVDD